MTHANFEILTTDRQSKTAGGFQSIPPSEMSRIDGGRCWDGPLGDRKECPPKPSPTGGDGTTQHFFTIEFSGGRID